MAIPVTCHSKSVSPMSCHNVPLAVRAVRTWEQIWDDVAASFKPCRCNKNELNTVPLQLSFYQIRPSHMENCEALWWNNTLLAPGWNWHAPEEGRTLHRKAICCYPKFVLTQAAFKLLVTRFSDSSTYIYNSEFILMYLFEHLCKLSTVTNKKQHFCISHENIFVE